MLLNLSKNTAYEARRIFQIVIIMQKTWWLKAETISNGNRDIRRVISKITAMSAYRRNVELLGSRLVELVCSNIIKNSALYQSVVNGTVTTLPLEIGG